MKKLLFCLLVFSLAGNLFSAVCRENMSVFYGVNISSYTPVTISSHTATTIVDAGINAIKRQFSIDGTCTGTVYYQYGGSTTTITTAGIPMEESSKLYTEDNYFGEIHFLTDTSTATLKVMTLIKK